MIKAPTETFTPVLQTKAAHEHKAAELHGDSAKKHGCKKPEGSLMANGADWKNT